MTATKWREFLKVCAELTDDTLHTSSAHDFVTQARTFAPEAARIALAAELWRAKWRKACKHLKSTPMAEIGADAMDMLDAILAGKGPNE